MMPPASNPHLLMTADTVGGVWTYASTLARQLAKRGWTISLVTLGPAPRQDQFLPLLSCPNIELEITDLELDWQDPEGHDRQRAMDYLAALEDRLRPDIVHANGYREACAPWRSPVLVTAHSCVGSWWRACRGSAPDDGTWDTYLADAAAALRGAKRWVAPTAAFRDTIKQLYAPSSHGDVIWNGIERHEIELGTPGKEPFILAAGRLWDEAKNVGVLADIAGGLTWPVRIAGATQNGASSAPVSDAAEWLGDLPHADLLAVMQKAGIFVSPAVYEPFGLTVLEAASSACALVLADIPTFRELWDGAALFVDPRNPSQLQATLAELSGNDAVRLELQEAARLRAKRYTPAAQVDAYERIYRDILDRPRRIRSVPLSVIEAAA
jgi:glycosyltransferase involved in cell wall biosynthesis